MVAVTASGGHPTSPQLPCLSTPFPHSSDLRSALVPWSSRHPCFPVCVGLPALAWPPWEAQQREAIGGVGGTKCQQQVQVQEPGQRLEEFLSGLPGQARSSSQGPAGVRTVGLLEPPVQQKPSPGAVPSLLQPQAESARSASLPWGRRGAAVPVPSRWRT